MSAGAEMQLRRYGILQSSEPIVRATGRWRSADSLDVSRNLAADLHVQHGIQRAGRGHGLGEIAADDGCAL